MAGYFTDKNKKLHRFAGGDNSTKYCLPVGTIFPSAIPLTDASVHLLDGGSISQTGVYQEFAELVKSLVSAGYNITCSISEYAMDIQKFGECGKFVINNTNSALSNATYNKKQDCIRYEGYTIDLGMVRKSENSTVVFIPVRRHESLRIFRETSPKNNYIMECKNSSIVFEDDNMFFTYSNPEYSQTQEYTVSYNECRYVAITVNNSDYDTLTITHTTELASIDANSIKLPTVTTFIQGLSNIIDIGKGVEAGLPNIKGSITRSDEAYPLIFGYNQNLIEEGALSSKWKTCSNQVDSSTGATSAKRSVGFKFDASKSSSIYGNSSTVQPQATSYPYYIVLASGFSNDVKLNIDNVMNEINNNQGIKFAETERLKSLNKFSSDIVQGAWYFATGNYGTATEYICNGTKIPCKPNTTYTISFSSTTGDVSFVGYIVYDSAGSMIGSQSFENQTITKCTFTTPSNAYYICFDFWRGSNTATITPNQITNVMLNEGSTALSYQPYYGDIVHEKTINELIPLYRNQVVVENRTSNVSRFSVFLYSHAPLDYIRTFSDLYYYLYHHHSGKIIEASGYYYFNNDYSVYEIIACSGGNGIITFYGKSPLDVSMRSTVIEGGSTQFTVINYATRIL